MELKRIAALLIAGCALLSPAFAGGNQAASGEAAPASPSSSSAASAPYTIEVSGSTSVTPLMEMLAAAYSKLRPLVRVNINGTGSSDGVKAAAAGTSELGMSSRELSPAEKGQGLTELVIAIDGIAVIVNRANPVSALSLEQIRGIYTGAITDWSALGGRKGRIAVVSREPGSGTRGAFEEIVGFQDRLLAGAAEFDGTGAVKAEVSRNADAIGYISLGSLDGSVQPVAVGGAAATAANVVNGSYRIARPFIVVYRRQSASAETARFLEWVLSAEGQRIVKTSWIAVQPQ